MIKVIRLLAAAALLVFCLQVFSDNKADVDLWGNLGFVTAWPGSPDFHRTNTFSFTEPNHPWVNHEWLSEYLLRQVYDVAGDQGLLLLKVLLGLALVLLMHESMRRDNVSPAIRWLCLLLIVSTIGYGFSTRPHLFTYLLYASFLFLLRHHAQRMTPLVLIPLLGLLWTNLHGAFFIGIVLLGLFVLLEAIKGLVRPAERLPRRQLLLLLLALVLFVGLTFVNPYGPRLWGFIFESAGKPRPYLSEWAPLNPLAHFASHPDFLMLSLLSVLVVLRRGPKRDPTWMTILGLSFLAAWLMRRNIPLFAITAAFVVPARASDWAGKRVESMLAAIPAAVRAGVLILAIVVSAWFTVHFNKTAPRRIEVPQNRFPSEIVEFMARSDLHGNALVFFDWAELCIWKLDPACSALRSNAGRSACKVFLDGRFTDAYSAKVVDDYLNFLYLGPHWENALSNYPTDILLIHTGNPVFKEMARRDDWQMVCTNRIAGLFLKKAEHHAFLARLQAGEIAPPTARKEVFFP